MYIAILIFLFYLILGLKMSTIVLLNIGFLDQYSENKIGEKLSCTLKKWWWLKTKILKKMWGNYGKIFVEYVFIKNFRNDPKFQKK